MTDQERTDRLAVRRLPEARQWALWYAGRLEGLWPYGPPCAHQDACRLHEGGSFCDCAASDASDTEWGAGA